MEIQLENVSFRYGRHLALDGLNLHLKDGVTGLLGPNGAGKSTLMQLLATLLQPQSGQIQVGPWRLPQEQRHVREHLGYLPQQFGLPGNLTGREYMRLAAAMKGCSDEAAETLLAEVELTAAAGRRIRTYSGGMQQRLAIAQALLGDPDLVIVDEPTAGLDPEQRTRFRHLLTQRRQGRITLFSTHVVADLIQVADQVAVLHQGRIRFTGTLDELAAQASGRVWLVERSEGERLPGSVTPIAEHWEEGRVITRVLAPSRPSPEAIPAVPTPEDGYLAVIGGAASPKGGGQP